MEGKFIKYHQTSRLNPVAATISFQINNYTKIPQKVNLFDLNAIIKKREFEPSINFLSKLWYLILSIFKKNKHQNANPSVSITMRQSSYITLIYMLLQRKVHIQGIKISTNDKEFLKNKISLEYTTFEGAKVSTPDYIGIRKMIGGLFQNVLTQSDDPYFHFYTGENSQMTMILGPNEKREVIFTISAVLEQPVSEEISEKVKSALK